MIYLNLKEWLTCFFSGLEIVFDYVCHNGSFGTAHVQGFLVGHATTHVPTDLQQFMTYALAFVVKIL